MNREWLPLYVFAPQLNIVASGVPFPSIPENVKGDFISPSPVELAEAGLPDVTMMC